MSVLTEWFEGRSVDEHYQRCDWTRVVLELACIVAAGLILAGCASTPKEEKPSDQVCLMKLVGRTGEGEPVVRLLCVTPEAFAEANK